MAARYASGGVTQTQLAKEYGVCSGTISSWVHSINPQLPTASGPVARRARGIAPDLIREARARAGITQSQLAGRVGTSLSLISQYETGGRLPPIPALIEVIRACGCELELRLVNPGDSSWDERQESIRAKANELAALCNESVLTNGVKAKRTRYLGIQRAR